MGYFLMEQQAKGAGKMQSRKHGRKQVGLTVELSNKRKPPKKPHRDDFLFEVVSQFIQRRKELGLSQEDVDHRMGTAERLCSKWECGLRIPTSFNFYCWAQALDAFLLLFPRSAESVKEYGYDRGT